MIKNVRNHLLVISFFIFNSIAVSAYGSTNVSLIFPQHELLLKDNEVVPIKRTLISYLIHNKLKEKSLSAQPLWG
jgi:hypothetical protein